MSIQHEDERWSPYRRWQAGEAIPRYTGSSISDLYCLDVALWPRLGEMGAFVNLAEQERDDAYLLEIAPTGQTEVQHHLFEALVYVLDGQGATTLWQEGTRKQTIEWQRGSVFSPPLNCYYQHFNLDGARPARLYVATNCPMMMNIFRNPEFIFHDAYRFTDRYAGQEDYFSNPGRRGEGRKWQTNFIPDVRAFQLDDRAERGAGGLLTSFALAGNYMAAHCSQFPSGTYKKAHYHGAGAHVIVLDGEGYSLLWRRGEERARVDWKDGTVLSPRDGEFHQHFNTGHTRARYLAFRFGSGQEYLRAPDGTEQPRPNVSEREGGTQVEYEDEDPTIYELYFAECTRKGVEVRLPRPK